MKIIGINGYKQSGKGTTAGIVTDLVRGNCVAVGFADKLKILGARTLGFSGPDEYLIRLMDEFKLTGGLEAYVSASEATKRHFTELQSRITGRQFLQNLGNNARIVFGEDFWVDQVLPVPFTHPSEDVAYAANRQALLNSYPNADYLLLTDLRYKNEAERIVRLGGYIWQVHRPGVSSDGHSSEQLLPESMVDYHLFNTNDVDHLVTEVEGALKCL